MALYKITLTPLAPYFFGSERSFNSDNNANYFVKSRLFPQQSTLLGLLRYDILRRNDLLASPGQGLSTPQKAEALVGAHSFSPTKSQATYGIIKQLFPLLLTPDKDQLYGIAPLDKNLEVGQAEIMPEAYYTLQGKRERPPTTSFTYYDEKEKKDKDWLGKNGLCHDFVNLLNFSSSVKADEIFVPQEQVGIIKESGGIDDSKGFYRQRKYNFKNGWQFCFYAEIADENLTTSYEKDPQSCIPVGGERVPFCLLAEKVSQLPEILNPNKASNSSKLVLLSDAFVPDLFPLLSQCTYAFVGDSIDFRSIFTETAKTKQYYNLTGRDKALQHYRAGFSKRYQLIPKGSVFALPTTQLGTFKQTISQFSPWREIGYNFFYELTA